MNNYTRGQETFLNRFFSFVQNIFRLFAVCALLSLIFLCTLLYFQLPQSFWKIEKEIFRYALEILRKDPLGSIQRTFDFSIEKTLSNYDAHQPFFDTSLNWSFVFFTFVFVGFFIFFARRGRILMDHSHKRGSQLISAEEFNREYGYIIKQETHEIESDSEVKQKSLTPKMLWGNPFVCSVDGIKLPEFSLFRHLAVVGTTGVGKSTLIKSYLEYCRKYGEKVIIPDVNGEYASEFYQEGDVILSLFDKKTSYWTFAAESEIHPFEFAKFLVPSGSEQNAFWWKGARQVVSQLLSQSESPEKLWEMINSEAHDLTSALRGLARKITGKEGSSQAAGVTGSSLLDLGFLEYLNRWPKELGNQNAFSLYNWSQNEHKNWVFITFSDTDRELMSPLLKLWLNSAILGLVRRNHENKLPPLNVVIDELSTVGKIELLPTALERARKYRGKVVLGYQSESQLLNLYGKEVGQTLKANTGTKFVFRCPESQEAKELSDFLGRQEVGMKNIGTTHGVQNVNDRESINEHEGLRNVVLDSEIRDLPDGHFFLKSLNINPVRSRIVKKRWPKVFQSEFCVPQAPEEGEGDTMKTETAPANHQLVIAIE